MDISLNLQTDALSRNPMRNRPREIKPREIELEKKNRRVRCFHEHCLKNLKDYSHCTSSKCKEGDD